jgi:hypothetical protein
MGIFDGMDREHGMVYFKAPYADTFTLSVMSQKKSFDNPFKTIESLILSYKNKGHFKTVWKNRSWKQQKKSRSTFHRFNSKKMQEKGLKIFTKVFWM